MKFGSGLVPFGFGSSPNSQNRNRSGNFYLKYLKLLEIFRKYPKSYQNFSKKITKKTLKITELIYISDISSVLDSVPGSVRIFGTTNHSSILKLRFR